MISARGDQQVLRGFTGVLVSAALAIGCIDDKQATAGTAGGDTTGELTTTGSTNSTSSTTDPTQATTMSAETTSATTEQTTDAPSTGSTTGAPKADMGGGAMCDPQLQDCADGLKCTAYESEDAQTPGWDANKCVPLQTNPGSVGDECELEPDASPFSGLDTCGEGSICLNFDFMTLTGGTCTEFCDERGECPNTAGGKGVCIVANGGVLPLCLTSCDPLIQDCPNGQGCYGIDVGFVCFAPDTGDGTGMDDAPCGFLNACAPGFSCASGAVLEGCADEGGGCCTPFCSLGAGDQQCAPPEECLPFYAMDPPPGYADVGICAIPQ